MQRAVRKEGIERAILLVASIYILIEMDIFEFLLLSGTI